MYDFINICYKGKDTPFLENLQLDTFNKCYLIEYGFKPLRLYWLPEVGRMNIKGSFPYYYQGHNFRYSISDFLNTIDSIQEQIHCEIGSAVVQEFEFGVIVEVDESPSYYLMNHNISSIRMVSDKHFRRWKDKGIDLKMYDAGRNFKEKIRGEERMNVIRAGWNPNRNYVKFEYDLKRPEILNGNRDVSLFDLSSQSFLEQAKSFLLSQYTRLEQTKEVILPASKKALSTQDILARAYVGKVAEDSGTPIDEARKALYRGVNSIPDSLLTKDDKNSRKRQIKHIFDKMRCGLENKWDLKNEIEYALRNEW